MKTQLKKLHITFADFDDIHNPLLGAGQARSTYEIGRRLVKQGHAVTVVSSKYPGSQDRIEAGIHYKHIGIGSHNIRLNNAAYVLVLPFKMLFGKADIVVECFTAPISTLCTPLYTKAVVIAKPTSFEAERFSKQYHLPFDLIEKIGARLYTFFLPSTPSAEEKMKRLNPHVVSKIISEGVDNCYFFLKQQDKQYILFLGRLDMKQKGLDILLDAYAAIADTCDYKLVIAGHGPDEGKLRSRVNKLGLNERVIFTGSLYGKAKCQMMKKSVVMALPSRHEGFSLVTLEALAAGLPVVMFDIPGLAWTKPVLPRKAKPFDQRDYTKVLQSYIKGNSKENSSVYKAYAKQFSWDTVAKEYLQFFYEAREHAILLKEKQSFGFFTFIIGKVRSVIPSNKKKRQFRPVKIPGYRFVQSVKAGVKSLMHATAIYQNKKGKKIVVRDLQYTTKSVEYYQAINEIKMLKILNSKTFAKYNGYSVVFPKLLSFSSENNRLHVVREFVQGVEMEKISSTKKIAVLEATLATLKAVSKQLSEEEISMLAKRTPLQMALAFPYYFIKVLFKEPKLLRQLCVLGIRFLLMQKPGVFSTTDYVLSHRDLHARNIFVAGKKISIIDSEIMVLAEEETDIAYMARFYVTQLNTAELLRFLKSVLKTKEQKTRFFRLSFFYTVQILANLYKSHNDYPTALRYLQVLQQEIAPALAIDLHPSFFNKLPALPKTIAFESK